MRILFLVLSLTLLVTPLLADENDAIALAVFDYIEGWYEGDDARMERALHPDLAKRIVQRHGDRDFVEHMGALRLVQMTRAGAGVNTPVEERRKEVILLDVAETTASVKAVMHAWIDYLHLAKVNGRWQIVNVLWELTPSPEED